MEAPTPQRRASPRAPLALDVTLARARAGDISGRTRDLGPSGMRVATRRPLRVDESLAFDLALTDGTHVIGRAHVVRQHGGDVYGLRFERLADGVAERLAGLLPG